MHLKNLLWRYRRTLATNMSSLKSRVTTIAVCQMTATNSKIDNLNIVTDLVHRAGKQNAAMVFLPEACDFITEKASVIKMAEPIVGGYTCNAYRDLARKHNVWISVGGFHEKSVDSTDKVYNTHIIINNEGDIVQAYRKLHLFDLVIPDKVKIEESSYVMPGSHIVTPVETPCGKVGMGICYDVRFQEMSTQMTILGAQILTYPSAFTVKTGSAHWEPLLRARAIENQCYVIASAQVGEHSAKRSSYGHAMVVDPWGVVQADCGTETNTFRTVDIDLDELDKIKRNMPVFSHRRYDMYSQCALALRTDLLPEHSPQKESLLKDSPSKESPLKELKTDEEITPPGVHYTFGDVKIPQRCVFLENKHTYAFVNLRCVTQGHVLVAPLRYVLRNENLNTEEASDFFDTIRITQQLMEKFYKCKSSTITIQDGVDAGQTVKHLHCHIMPRKPLDFLKNDLIYLELARHDVGEFRKPARSMSEMEAEAEALRKYYTEHYDIENNQFRS